MEKRPHFLSRVLKWTFNPQGRGPDPIRTLVFANPLLILALSIMSDGFGPHFWRRYLYGLLIGEGVASMCILFSQTAALVGFRILKIHVPRRTFVMLNAAAMIPGLWFGFRIADTVFGYYGEARDSHSYGEYGSGVMMGAMFLGMYSLIDMWFTSQKHAKDLEKENLEAKLSALSAQMNPHLLFNALNTIASTISSNPAAAEETTLKLSDLYRGILASSRQSSHELARELDICRAYLGIEKDRFGDRLQWSIDCDQSLGHVKIPALLIQPLVENAIKHGISAVAQGGKVMITISRLEGSVRIRVEDNGIGFGNSRQTKGTGTGVSSCRARLDLLYLEKAVFEIGKGDDGIGTRVEIRIPVETQS